MYKLFLLFRVCKNCCFYETIGCGCSYQTIDHGRTSKIVYGIACEECDHLVYVGETEKLCYKRSIMMQSVEVFLFVLCIGLRVVFNLE